MMEKESSASAASTVAAKSFSAVCSPPLALLYASKKKKGKSSFTLHDLDEELCDALCKISKSSEELWKEITPPSPITSKSTHSDWTLDSVASGSSQHSGSAPRVEVDSREGSASPTFDPSRFHQGPYNNSSSRGARGTPPLNNHLSPVRPMASSSVLPTSSAISNMVSSLPQQQPQHHSQYQMPVISPTPVQTFSSSFSSFLNPSFNMTPPANIGNIMPNSSSSMSANNSAHTVEPFTTGHPSITTNSISINGNVSSNTQNTSNHTSPSSSPHMHNNSASAPTLRGTKENIKQPTFPSSTNSPPLKMQQYSTIDDGFNRANKGTNNALSDNFRHRENERLWGEIVVGCQKLAGHAERGKVQPLPWGEFNDSMNSARHIMTSLVALLQLNSFAYANIYSSVTGMGMHGIGDEFSRFQEQHAMQLGPNLGMHSFDTKEMSLDSNSSNSSINVSSSSNSSSTNFSPFASSSSSSDSSGLTGLIMNSANHLPAYAFDDVRRKLPRKEGSTMVSSREGSNDPTGIGSPITTIPPSQLHPTLSLSPVITALSNLTPGSNSPSPSPSANASPTEEEASPKIEGGGSASGSASGSGSGGGGGHTKGSWKKNRGKKRSKYSDPDLMCLSCGVKQTPEWRRGPAGAKTLCNACGLHWAKVLKAEGKGASTDSKKAYMLEQKRNQFMILAKKEVIDSVKSEPQ